MLLLQLVDFQMQGITMLLVQAMQQDKWTHNKNRYVVDTDKLDDITSSILVLIGKNGTNKIDCIIAYRLFCQINIFIDNIFQYM